VQQARFGAPGPADPPRGITFGKDAVGASRGGTSTVPSTRILVVDDEAETATMLRIALGAFGYDVNVVADGEGALAAAALREPDAIILDLMLPDMNGLEVCRVLREWSKVPIIIVSARVDTRSQVEALNLGADDYVVKPFHIEELEARVRAVLRRGDKEPAAAMLSCGELELDQMRRVVTLAGRQVRLTPTEYEILKHLMTHAGMVVTYSTLLRTVWGHGYEGANPNLRVFIAHLRQKIERYPDNPEYIRTESRIGYRLCCP
jgi:two-component system KDP operon response regulator KdpE